jgi:hypothetical protein
VLGPGVIDSAEGAATLDRARKALHATPDGDYETRMRTGLVAQRAGLDVLDWLQWIESHGHTPDREALGRLWYLFQFVSTQALCSLFLTSWFLEAA